jgi:superfamily II DNA or RNA helicase
VREAAGPAVWSRGVELVRAGAVIGEAEREDEIVLRIALRGGILSHAVSLHLADEAWECDCRGTDDPCEHVAAAVIALRRARQEGRALPAPAAGGPGRIGYRFTRAPGGLALEREVVAGSSRRPLETTLSAVASGRVEGPSFVATPSDLAAERALGSRLRGLVPREALPRLLAALAECSDVTLDGRPISVSTERVLPLGRVVDQGEGFLLYVERDPGLSESFANGAALCGDVLRPIGESGLTGRELEELPRGRSFGPGEVAELVTEVLPSLARRIPLEIRTSRLPRTEAARPRLVVDARREGDALSVLATLVYGDPPTARVDAGRLVHLGGNVPLRDLPAEARCLRELQSALELAPGHRVWLRGEEAMELAERLRRWRGGTVTGGGHAAFFRAPPLVPRLRVASGSFELFFECEAPTGGRGRRVEASAVLRAWREGAAWVPLEGGGMAPLPADWLARCGGPLADLLAAREVAGSLPAASLPDLGRLCASLGQPPPPELARLRALLEGFEGVPPAPLPADLQARLRGYQRRGVDWLCWMRDAGLGALLADDMGLGKTLQALCAIRGRTLVVSPTSVLHNWAHEIQRFRPALRACLYHGPRRTLEPAADVVLTSYALLRLDAEKLREEHWGTLVLDEAQNIKNPDSQTARAAYALQADFRIALSGTPVENRLDELWSQLHFLNPGLLGSREDFEARYARPIAEGEEGVAARLRERIRPFVLRRLKREVAPELPPRTDVVLRCTLSPEERAVYDAVRAAARAEVVEKLRAGGGVLAALEALLRLRQAACHVGLVPGQRAESSAKLELLLEELDTVRADGHKALVFSQWTSLLDRLEPRLAGAGMAWLRLDGSTPDRAGVVARFQEEAGPPILLSSLKAGGTGLNLTAADHVFLLDPWWNPAAEDQAADRAHRIGQERPVFVYRLVAEDTVEERILALQESKRTLQQAALGEADAAAALSREDLLALLE